MGMRASKMMLFLQKYNQKQLCLSALLPGCIELESKANHKRGRRGKEGPCLPWGALATAASTKKPHGSLSFLESLSPLPPVGQSSQMQPQSPAISVFGSAPAADSKGSGRVPAALETSTIQRVPCALELFGCFRIRTPLCPFHQIGLGEQSPPS
jgi:hypothetical protein